MSGTCKPSNTRYLGDEVGLLEPASRSFLARVLSTRDANTDMTVGVWENDGSASSLSHWREKRSDLILSGEITLSAIALNACWKYFWRRNFVSWIVVKNDRMVFQIAARVSQIYRGKEEWATEALWRRKLQRKSRLVRVIWDRHTDSLMAQEIV